MLKSERKKSNMAAAGDRGVFTLQGGEPSLCNTLPISHSTCVFNFQLMFFCVWYKQLLAELIVQLHVVLSEWNWRGNELRLLILFTESTLLPAGSTLLPLLLLLKVQALQLQPILPTDQILLLYGSNKFGSASTSNPVFRLFFLSSLHLAMPQCKNTPLQVKVLHSFSSKSTKASKAVPKEKLLIMQNLASQNNIYCIMA